MSSRPEVLGMGIEISNFEEAMTILKRHEDAEARVRESLRKCNTALSDINFDRDPYAKTNEQKTFARQEVLYRFHNAVVTVLHDLYDMRMNDQTRGYIKCYNIEK